MGRPGIKRRAGEDEVGRSRAAVQLGHLSRRQFGVVDRHVIQAAVEKPVHGAVGTHRQDVSGRDRSAGAGRGDDHRGELAVEVDSHAARVVASVIGRDDVDPVVHRIEVGVDGHLIHFALGVGRHLEADLILTVHLPSHDPPTVIRRIRIQAGEQAHRSGGAVVFQPQRDRKRRLFAESPVARFAQVDGRRAAEIDRVVAGGSGMAGNPGFVSVRDVH